MLTHLHSRWFICFPKLRFSDQRKTPQWQTGLCPNNKKLPSCKRTRVYFTSHHLVHCTGRILPIHAPSNGGKPSGPIPSQFQAGNSGVMFSRFYLHRASTCPRLSEAFDLFSVSLNVCGLLSPSQFLRDRIYRLYYKVYKFHLSSLFPDYSKIIYFWGDIFSRIFYLSSWSSSISRYPSMAA